MLNPVTFRKIAQVKLKNCDVDYYFCIVLKYFINTNLNNNRLNFYEINPESVF